MSEVVYMAEARKRLRPTQEARPKIDLMATFAPEHIIAERVNTADTVPTEGNELSRPYRDPAKPTQTKTPVAHDRSDEAFEAAMNREYALPFDLDEI